LTSADEGPFGDAGDGSWVDSRPINRTVRWAGSRGTAGSGPAGRQLHDKVSSRETRRWRTDPMGSGDRGRCCAAGIIDASRGLVAGRCAIGRWCPRRVLLVGPGRARRDGGSSSRSPAVLRPDPPQPARASPTAKPHGSSLRRRRRPPGHPTGRCLPVNNSATPPPTATPHGVPRSCRDEPYRPRADTHPHGAAVPPKKSETAPPGFVMARPDFMGLAERPRVDETADRTTAAMADAERWRAGPTRHGSPQGG